MERCLVQARLLSVIGISSPTSSLARFFWAGVALAGNDEVTLQMPGKLALNRPRTGGRGTASNEVADFYRQRNVPVIMGA